MVSGGRRKATRDRSIRFRQLLSDVPFLGPSADCARIREIRFGPEIVGLEAGDGPIYNSVPFGRIGALGPGSVSGPEPFSERSSGPFLRRGCSGCPRRAGMSPESQCPSLPPTKTPLCLSRRDPGSPAQRGDPRGVCGSWSPATPSPQKHPSQMTLRLRAIDQMRLLIRAGCRFRCSGRRGCHCAIPGEPHAPNRPGKESARTIPWEPRHYGPRPIRMHHQALVALHCLQGPNGR
jgi:hypothetical protein